MIPKRIYYIWLGKKPISKKIQENINSWKNLNPDFEICRIDESNFDINEYRYIKEAYEAGYWAYASDLVRLVVIYRNGGFYFDTDTKMIRSLNSLLKYKSVWALETPGIVASGLIIGANKGDRNLKNLIQIYKNKKFDSNDLYNVLTTKIISEYFQSKGLKLINKQQVLKDGTIILPSDYFAPYHWWGGGHLTKRTIAIQQYDKSWDNNKSISLLNKVKLNFKHNFPSLFFLMRRIKKS